MDESTSAPKTTLSEAASPNVRVPPFSVVVPVIVALPSTVRLPPTLKLPAIRSRASTTFVPSQNTKQVSPAVTATPVPDAVLTVTV